MRNDWPPNAPGAPLFATTAWSYPFGSEGMLPGTALFQLGGATGCPLTDPVWKAVASKSVATVSAAATPHTSQAQLTNVASKTTIAARGAGRVTLREWRTATPSLGTVTRLDQKAVRTLTSTRFPPPAGRRAPHGPWKRPFIESKNDVADCACAPHARKAALPAPLGPDVHKGSSGPEGVRRRTAHTALEGPSADPHRAASGAERAAVELPGAEELSRSLSGTAHGSEEPWPSGAVPL